MDLMKNIVTQAAVRTTPRPLLEFSEAIGLFLVVDKQQRRQGDCPFVSYALFNEAEECGDAVITSGAWSEVHPSFVGIPLVRGIQVPCFLAYPSSPTPQVAHFVDAMRRALAEQGR